MPFADHATLIDELAAFLKEDVRAAIPEDEAFVRAQIGSAASTMRFLSKELAELGIAIETQEAAFEDALASLESSTQDDTEFGAQVATARAEFESLPTATGPRALREREQQFLAVVEALLEAAEDLPPERARDVRQPLYDVLDTRVDAQLAMLRGDLREEGETQ